jgi:hypothetical protein
MRYRRAGQINGGCSRPLILASLLIWCSRALLVRMHAYPSPRMGEFPGIAVLDLMKGLRVGRTRKAPSGPDATAAIWTLHAPEEGKRIRVLVESTPATRDDYWAIGDDWAFIERSDGLDAPAPGTASITRTRVGANWAYSWEDYEDAILVVLPPELGVAEATPPPRATVKKDRLILWFTRPAGTERNWQARWQTYPVASKRMLGMLAATLNHNSEKIRSQHEPHSEISVEFINPKPDVGAKVATIMACVAGVAAVLALSHGTARTVLLVVSLLCTAVAAAWLALSLKPVLRRARRALAELCVGHRGLKNRTGPKNGAS